MNTIKMCRARLVLTLLVITVVKENLCCNFYPVGEYLKFVRIPEDLRVGDEVLRVEVHPRKNLSLQPVDREEDAHLFTYRDLNRTHVSVVLAQSIDHLVDSDSPQNVVKFRLGCDFDAGDDLISAYLSVTVYIEDVNDNVPEFQDTPYEVTVDELTPTGLTIFKGIHAFDRDKPNTPNSDVQYAIISGDAQGHFALESSHKPALILMRALDYDAGDKEFLLVISASDRGSPPRSSNATVHIKVLDNDDLPPKFTQDVYRTQIPEFYPILGKRIHRELLFNPPIQAIDGDAGVRAALRYELVSAPRGVFSLSPHNATLFLEKEVDLDTETGLSANTFVLQIQASQVDNPLKTAQARVEIEILDLNDNLPEFEVDFYNISIVENLPNGFSVLQVMATDKDQGDNGEFTYQLNDPAGAFSIDPRTGWLTVRNQTVLDREEHASLRMKVYAKEKNPSVVGTFFEKQRTPKWRRTATTPRPFALKDKTTYVFPDKLGTKSENIEYFDDQLMSYVNVEVTLLDANDNNPSFVPSNLYEFTVKSNAKIGTFIGKVKAVDPDLSRNGMVFYDLQRTSNLTITSPFQVDAQSGVISVAETPIVEGRHALFIEASDQPANPSERRYSLAVVTIDVTRATKGKSDRPGFIGAPYEFWVGSNVGIGTSVGQIRVNDAMDKKDVTYDLLHGYEEGVPFAVEERSGVITVIDELSNFHRPMYDFEAVAINEKANLTIFTNATVHVVDVNDERGVLLKGAHSPLVFHVKENVAGATIGQIFNTSSSSLNNTGNIRFIIANQQDVTDDIAIGEDGTIYAQKPLDREKRDTYRMTVIAEFNKGLISGAGIYQVTIHVDDENDNPPVFEYPAYEGFITENSVKGTEVKMVNKIKAKDPDSGPNAIFMYTFFGEGREMFVVDDQTGIVTFIGNKLDREEKSVYLLRIVARDRGGLSSESKLTITVGDENDNEPKFNQIVIPIGESVELLEVDDKSPVKIYQEKKNNSSSGIINVIAKPKNKFALKVDELGPLFSVPENIAIGSTVLKLHAVDKDSGINGQVRYEFISELFIPPYAKASAAQPKRYFVINERHGHIIVARTLPPESEFRINVSAIDGGELSDNISLRIFVKDINDHFPMFKKSWYNFNVEEAQYTRRVLGKVDATDADFGQNANLTYFIQPSSIDLPFEISPHTGVFSVNGELDREREDKYILTVVVRDNGSEKKLSSSVSVEVQVLDVNDNAPKFYAYDEILEWKHPEADELSNHNFESVMMIPVYRATLPENSPIGTTVTKVYANDSDFIGNGNGLILYSLPQKKNQMNLFAIDSKEGTITTTSKLDFENQSVHNITIVASDLGSPSLSSTALLMLTVTDVPDDMEISDKPVFISRYYELEIEENVQTPVELVTLNLTEYYENFKMRYYILNENDTDIKKTFVIDPRNGTLYLVRSPDREMKDIYEIIVRGERQKISRELPHMIYPVADEVLEGMSKFDVKVIVRIKDVNDNAPKFINGGRPFVTAIPTTAPFGYQVMELKAIDADAGINADIRYALLGGGAARFALDPTSGALRVVAPLTSDGGTLFGFDVKATDKRGADDGKSAIANVFVYVLDENKQLVLVVGGKPMEVEKHIDNITDILTGITGYDIRVRRLEANMKTSMDGHATNMYIYGVDPLSNAIIDMDVLQKSLMKRESDLRQNLAGFKVLEVGDTTMVQARSGKLLSTMEISVVALGCLVFVGACTTAICILCVRKSRRKHHKPYTQQRLNAFSTEHLTKYGGLFPSGGNQCQELNQSYSEADSYIDVINHNVSKKICPHGNTVEEFGKAHQKCVKNQFGEAESYAQKHERMCIKFNQRPLQKRKGQDTSITSVNSSGQDSGIAEITRCPCGQSSMHTSEESSGCSYEDSLKSAHNQDIRKSFRPDDQRFRRASFNHQPLDRQFIRRQSFSENMRHYPPFDRRITRHISTPNVSNLNQPYFMNNKRKDNKRKEVLSEPVIDYDNSEGEDVFDTRLERRASKKNKRSKFIEMAPQAVFVTPAAAEMMRRQGSERLMFARPM